jgi:[acyl-carrier-protein] S-malonyltransferase
VLIFTAPGQGAQTPGFLSPWLELPGLTEKFGAWSELAGRDLIRLGTTGGAEEITDTAVAQPLLVAAALAVAELLGEPDAAAGHSVGELAAGAIAGVMSAEDAIKLTRVRGEAMALACGYRGVEGGSSPLGQATACGAEPTGMTAVLGGEESAVLTAIANAGLTPANINTAGQIVAGGTLEQLAEFAANPPAGARLRPLRVAGAFHTKHMAPAVDALAAAAAGTTISDPVITLLSNRDGAVVTSGPNWVDRIVSQVANPVRWDLCMATMSDINVTALIELVPGGTLAGLAKRALPGVELLALKTPDQLDAARALVAAHAASRNGYAAAPGSAPEWRIVVAPGAGTVRLGIGETEAEAGRTVWLNPGAIVSAGDILGFVTARGGQKVVTAPHDAVLAEWLVEDGDPVSEGQPLVRLVPQEV